MIKDDDAVDHLYSYSHDELIDFMKRDPSLVDQGAQLLLISRYLERTADHIANIGERVFYVEDRGVNSASSCIRRIDFKRAHCGRG